MNVLPSLITLLKIIASISLIALAVWGNSPFLSLGCILPAVGIWRKELIGTTLNTETKK